MQLLVSAINLDETKQAILGNADILDIKNPLEGSLGANFPWVIRQISDYVDGKYTISTTVGDVPYKPATVALAALGCAYSGSNYVKVGLLGPSNYEEALEVMDAVVRTINDYDKSITVVSCGYADAENIGSIQPEDIPKVAKDSKSDIAMLDTYNKKGMKLTDYLSVEDLRSFVDASHKENLKVALAGSVNESHIDLLKSINCDIMGVRGCVCTNNDRNNGTVTAELVRKLKDKI